MTSHYDMVWFETQYTRKRNRARTRMFANGVRRCGPQLFFHDFWDFEKFHEFLDLVKFVTIHLTHPMYFATPADSTRPRPAVIRRTQSQHTYTR
jgi:hypothetical protein